MPSTRTEKMYERLVEIYGERGHKDPVLSLNYDVEKLRNEGMSREKAVSTLYGTEKSSLLMRREGEVFAEKRIKELEKELKELRMAELTRAEDIE
ncbi:MAG: hypothetical protein WCC63_02460, partial [Candidatus Bathyarchaeia archaeon]